MSAVDKEYRNSSLWDTASKLVKMVFFFSPIVVMVTDGPSPAYKERRKIKKSAQEWRKYLTKTPDGKRLVGSYQGKDGGKQIEAVVRSIMEGRPPHDAKIVSGNH